MPGSNVVDQLHITGDPAPAGCALALYDLDRTITIAPTFTPFLVHMAGRGGGWRLLLLPAWLFAMIGYKLGLFGRKPLKQFGLRLLVGREVRTPALQPLIDRFIQRQLTRNIRPGAKRRIQDDRRAGRKLVLVTAAPEIYAESLAAKLGFDACIATRHVRDQGGVLLAQIDGENNYGTEKVRRIERWLTENQIERARCHVVAYTDHASDAPFLDYADQGFLVGSRSSAAPACVGQLDWGL